MSNKEKAQQASEEIMRAVQTKNNLVKQLTTTRINLDHKKQLITRSRLTLEELSPIEAETKSYRAVGRMFLSSDLGEIRSEIQDIIDKETVEIAKLEKNFAALQTRVQAAEADFRELVATIQGPTPAQ